MPGEVKIDSLSEFGQTALSLDQQLGEFESLGREFAALDIESDKGFARGGELLMSAVRRRERLKTLIRDLAQKLDEARRRNEETESQIAARTEIFQKRQEEIDRLVERFRTLSGRVSELNELVKQVRQPSGDRLSEEGAGALDQVAGSLSSLVDEAKDLVEQTRSRNMKTLERNADALRKSLQVARNRIQLLVQKNSEAANPEPGSASLTPDPPTHNGLDVRSP